MKRPTNAPAGIVQPSEHASYFKLADGKFASNRELGVTPNGDMVIADVDAKGRLLGIELVGPLPRQDGPMRKKSDTRLKLPDDFLGNVKALLATPPPPKAKATKKPVKKRAK